MPVEISDFQLCFNLCFGSYVIHENSPLISVGS